MFIPPMLASPLPNKKKNPKAKDFTLEPGKWVAEEKFDGIRLITEVSAAKDRLFVEKGITSWSRYANVRPLPEHIMEKLAALPDCIIDGELCAPGKRSYGTMELANAPDLVYFVFDVLQIEGEDVTAAPYLDRRHALKDLVDFTDNDGPLQLAPAIAVNTWDEVFTLRDAVWARDGEGLILKRLDAPYSPGKRSKDFIKIKQLQSALFTIIGFVASRGEINDRGPFAMVKLLDDEGNITAVKTKNDAQLAKFAEESRAGGVHPALGRKLWCEYQERTPDGSYRHIRWDHWENE